MKPIRFIAFTWPTTGDFFRVSNKEGSPLGNYSYPPRCFEGATPRHVPVDLNHSFDTPLTAELWYDDNYVYGAIRLPDFASAIPVEASFHRREFQAVSPAMNVLKSHLVNLDDGGTYIVGDEMEISGIALVRCSANPDIHCLAWVQNYDFDTERPMHIPPPLFEDYRATFHADIIRAGNAKSIFIRNEGSY